MLPLPVPGKVPARLHLIPNIVITVNGRRNEMNDDGERGRAAQHASFLCPTIIQEYSWALQNIVK